MASYSYTSIKLPLITDGRPHIIVAESREEARSAAHLFARLIPQGIITVHQHRFAWPDSRKQLVEKIKADEQLTKIEEYAPFLILDCAAHGGTDNKAQLFERLQQLGHIQNGDTIDDYVN
jgi:alkanesulfonate monooxygenase SsuD/methylene tetrahydromethanopterin reductase-like flavin-dependent oxidoreductase (luciferase family)